MGGVLGLVVLLAAFVLAIPVLFGGRIDEAVRAQASESLLADVEIGDIGISLFAQFPLLEVRVDDVAVVGREPYAGVTLLEFESLSLGVDLWSVVSGSTLEVRRVEWVEPAIDVRVAEDGTSNLDIFPPGEEEAEVEEGPDSAFAIVLESLTVQGLDLAYADASLGVSTELRDLATQLSGRFDASVASVAAEASAAGWSLSEGGIPLVRDARLDVDLDLDYALDTGAITLRDNTFRLNELAVSFAGTVTPAGDDTDLDLTFGTEQSSFKALFSLVPAAYVEGYEDVKVDGTFSLAGTAEGRLPAEGEDLPGFSLDIEVDDGRVQYPDLPGSVEGIELAMSIAHPQGPVDATVVDVPRFAFSLADAPMRGSLKLENPVTDPKVALTASGSLDFVKLAAAMPGQGLPSEGVMDVDVDIAGRSSDFEAGNVEAVRASGTVAARDLMITDTGYATPVRVQRLEMAFTPVVLDVTTLALSWLGSDLDVTAQLDNVVPYALGQAPLVGKTQLSSRVLDLRPFQGETADDGGGEPTEESEGVVVVVPADLDLAMKAEFGEVVTSDFRMRDVRGQLSVADQAMVIDEMTASMLGGRVRISGRYAARTPESAEIDFRIETIAFDLPQTVSEFETLARVAPLLRGVTGTFDSDFQLSSRIDRDGNPDLGALASRGSLLAQGLMLTPVTLNAAASQLDRPSLNALEVAEKQLQFVIEQGKLTFEPFDARLGGYAARVSGGAGLADRTLDFAVDLGLPASVIAGSRILEGVSGAADTVDLRLDITGSYDDPKVAVGLAEGKSVRDAVIDAARERAGVDREALVKEATERGDALVAAAEERAATIRAEGEKQADKLRREGRQQANKLEREAGNNPIKKAAAKTAADAARRSADRAATKVEREADAQADRIVSEAKSQRQRLVREARGD